MAISELISLIELELDVIVATALVADEEKEIELADRALLLGLLMANKHIALSDLMMDCLRCIEAKNIKVFDNFKYAYNGAISIGNR